MRALNEHCVVRLRRWREQLQRIYPGAFLRDEDLLEWLVLRKDVELTHRDLVSIHRHFPLEIELGERDTSERRAICIRREDQFLRE